MAKEQGPKEPKTLKLKGELLTTLDTREPVWEFDTRTGQHRIVVGEHVGEWASYIQIAQITTPRGASYFAVTENYRGTFQPGKVYSARQVPSRERIVSSTK